jgi:hypothetical protein
MTDIAVVDDPVSGVIATMKIENSALDYIIGTQIARWPRKRRLIYKLRRFSQRIPLVRRFIHFNRLEGVAFWVSVDHFASSHKIELEEPNA